MRQPLLILLSFLCLSNAFAQENVKSDPTILNARLDTNAQIVGGLIVQKVEWPAENGWELLPPDSTSAFLLVSTTFDSTDFVRTATLFTICGLELEELDALAAGCSSRWVTGGSGLLLHMGDSQIEPQYPSPMPM